MESEGERYRLFGRRAALLFGAQGALVTALAGRMYYLGVVEAGQYKTLADDNRLSLRLLEPERGEILDRFGIKIATNRQDFRVVLIPESAHDTVATLERVGRIIPISTDTRTRIDKQMRSQRSFLPVMIADNLEWDEFARVNVAAPELSGIQTEEGRTRFYPDGPNLAHVIGYVGAVSEDDEGEDPILQIPGVRIGRAGVEKVLDQPLRGVAGNRRVEVNAYGRVIREVQRQNGEVGEDAWLTLDMALQRFVVERLGDESAAAVVMDVHTGDLLSVASTPAFDPNMFNVGISKTAWNALLSDPRKPLLSKCVKGQFPPGSTFKPVVALAAQAAGVDPTETVFCNGKHRFGDRTFHCWKRQGHGHVNMVEALGHSCDIYFYEIAKKTGIDNIAKFARTFGLGQSYEIELQDQSKGLVPTRAWKEAVFGVPWQKGETLIVGIGQGYLLATPLQLAVMTARLANGGRAIEPRLVARIGDQDMPVGAGLPLNIPRSHLRVVQRGMEMVTEEGGTAYGSRIRDEGLSMAGKTGTAQVRRITKAERDTRVLKNEEKPWEERDHALFVGYGPIEAPRYAVSVLVEHGGGGSKVAAPIARDILREALIRDSGREGDVPHISSDAIASL